MKKIIRIFLLSFLMMGSVVQAELLTQQGSLSNSMAAARSMNMQGKPLSETIAAAKSMEEPKVDVQLNQTPGNFDSAAQNAAQLSDFKTNKMLEIKLIDTIPMKIDNRPLSLILATDDQFAPFLDLVKSNAEPLLQTIQRASSGAPLTLFVPTKDVFNKLALFKPEILNALHDPKLNAELQRLLKLHAAQGEFLSLASHALSVDPALLKIGSSKNLASIKTAANTKIPFNFVSNKLMLGDSHVRGVIKGQNGTIFLIDNLLTDKTLGDIYKAQKELLRVEIDNKIQELQKRAKELSRQ